ncbi:hypothetical protein [Candidatus Phyllobacterium onerii]|uniref:hypothetical protein n=1 Tax=Candidatus Phyllobacterium onerii TaxID=3020828 RepID=UPI00232E40F9|nr:hypothetical protein [Phyllobacterium sp. IY22]
MANNALDQKIAHLQMIQGVIGRMASDAQNLKTLAIAVAAAIIALGQTAGGITPWLAVVGTFPIVIFWWLNARYLHIERAYRHLYDLVRTDQPVEAFLMDWRSYRTAVASPLKIAFTQSVLFPYAAVIMILLLIASFAWGGASDKNGANVDGRPISRQVQ